MRLGKSFISIFFSSILTVKTIQVEIFETREMICLYNYFSFHFFRVMISLASGISSNDKKMAKNGIHNCPAVFKNSHQIIPKTPRGFKFLVTQLRNFSSIFETVFIAFRDPSFKTANV